MLQALMTQTPVVTDGAWGTQLQAQGLPIGACPDAWNLYHPDRVAAVARAYGMPASDASTPEELAEALRAGIAASDGPRLVQARIASGMWAE